MKGAMPRAAFLTTVALTIAPAAIAQLATSSAAAKTTTEFAHLTVAPRSGAFGKVKAITTKSIKIKNTGNVDATVTVVGPPSVHQKVGEGFP